MSKTDETQQPIITATKQKGILKEPSDFSQQAAVDRLALSSVRFKKDTVGASRRTQGYTKPKDYNTWTLILTNPSQQAEFAGYLRKKSRSYAKVFLTIIGVICLFGIAALFLPEGATKQTLVQVLILFGVSALIAAVMFVCSGRYTWLVELIGPSLHLSFAMCLFAIEMTLASDEVSFALARIHF